MNEIKDVVVEFEEIIAVMVFGSVARNENDNVSDIDVFVLVKDSLNDYEKDELVKKIESLISSCEVNVSIYTQSVFEKMKEEGSLFLWHLFLEGEYVVRGNEDIFDGLNDFKDYKKNFVLYENILEKTNYSLKQHGVNSFDLSMLFFLCRNLCILTSYKIGVPVFGRYSAYENLVKKIGKEPISHENYRYLSKWRMEYTRGIQSGLEYPSWIKV